MPFPAPNVVSVRLEPKKKTVLRQFLTNHFRVNFGNTDDYFYEYSVSFSYEDGHPVQGKGVGRKVLDKLQKTCNSELNGKDFAYDGDKTLFTLGSLASKNLEFTVVSTSSHDKNPESSESDKKRMRHPNRAKTLKVQLSFASKISLQAIVNAHSGQGCDKEAIRVLDIILRQHAAKEGRLLVRESFFRNDPKNFDDIGEGVQICRGFHSSFRTTLSGLSLNIDVSSTTIVTPGPVLDFLKSNQCPKDPSSIDWVKAKRTLKNLRIKTSTSNQVYKITGLSDHTCKEQMFTLKKKGGVDGDDETQEVSVYDYFVKHRNIPLSYSEDLPCISVGKPTRPTYFPLELCSLVSLQRYTKALTTNQRSSLLEKSRQTPQEKMGVLMTDALSDCKYDSEPMLRNCGISINPSFTEVEGRILQAPRLEFGEGKRLNPTNGRWNFNGKKLIKPSKIGKWYVVDFSGRSDLDILVKDFVKCGQNKGITINDPDDTFRECFANKSSPQETVEKMFNIIFSKLSEAPQFLLCLLPVRNSDLYGPWKRMVLIQKGVVTQCIAPPSKVNDQYLTNVWLKINAKLGGLNSMLRDEVRGSIPVVSRVPTIIIGMDVSHGSPSIAAVVGSREWPGISKYRACVRTQSPKVEMIDNLFKKVSEVNSDGTRRERDGGMIQEVLKNFYTSSRCKKPQYVIIFRNGVNESQFNQVLNIELSQIIEACKYKDPEWNPKFLVIAAQKNHHTRFFQPGSPDNVPPGTVVDNVICHPRNYDFYMCAHAVKVGTGRPTHYHVLLDEIGLSGNNVQELVHSLSYMYQRSSSAVSVVAPLYYAHLAATQMGEIMKFEKRLGAAADPVPQLPELKENISESMFFC